MLISEFITNEKLTFPMTNAEVMKRYCGYSRGVLPHFSYENGLFFLTTRLYDSVPEWVIRRKSTELNIVEHRIPNPAGDKVDSPEYQDKLIQLWDFIQTYEDKGYGQCFLRQHEIAQMVLDALKFYDCKDYQLLAWTIMPNHIHFLIRLLNFCMGNLKDSNEILSKIMRKIKGYTAKQANHMLGRENQPFWQKEYYDRYIRNEKHLRNVVKYIVNNPRKINYTLDYTGTIFDD